MNKEKVRRQQSPAYRKRKIDGQGNRQKNKPLKPTDVTPGSNKQVWWTCGKGHEWQQTVANRFKGFGCPVCILEARRKIG